MIIGFGTQDGNFLTFIGLSKSDLETLQDGGVVMRPAAEYGVVSVMLGETDDALQDRLRELGVLGKEKL